MHRDYHMGFQPMKEIERYPAQAHRLPPVMTLQGAVTHVDMPVDSGPILYLPYSQAFEPDLLRLAPARVQGLLQESLCAVAARQG